MNDLLGSLDVLLVLLRGRVVDHLLNLDVLAFDALNLLFLLGFVLPVLVELREARPDIVDEQLREFFVSLDYEAKELPVVVVDHLA